MDAIETQVQRTSPILRVGSDITELKSRESKEYSRLTETSRSGHSGEANLQHASNLLQKKKHLRPIFGSPNPYRSSSFINNSPYAIHPDSKAHVGPFTQRVMSAKLLRVKQLQNELKETQIQLHDAINENRVLKTLQKRQDNALRKYEGDHAQLPQLIKSHNDEMRVLSTQFKQLKASYRELEQKLRQRDLDLANLKEEHRHLISLSRDKHLGHRERLTKQVEDLKEIIKEQNDKIQLLTRRVELEGKNHKHQLNVEMSRHRDTQTELAMAHETIESLKNLIEAKDKYINNSVPNRFYKPPAQSDANPNIQIFTTAPSTNRYKNLPKTPAHVVVEEKQDSEETVNNAIDELHQDTDITSELSSANENRRRLRSVSSKQVTESSMSLNFRKKVLTRKSRNKSNSNNRGISNLENFKLELNNENENDTETPQYTSSFPSIENSEDSMKFNTTSESDTVTKIGPIIKNRRRVSLDVDHTVIDNNCSSSNNIVVEGNDCKNVNSDINEHNIIKLKTKSPYSKKIMTGNSTERLRRNSVSICESEDKPLESITDALAKAKVKDESMRKLMINNELKELEEKLKKNNSQIGRKLSLPPKDENLFDDLFDRNTQSIKEELREFEERLLNTNEIGKYSSSISKSFEDEADNVVRNITKDLKMLPGRLQSFGNNENDYDDDDDDGQFSKIEGRNIEKKVRTNSVSNDESLSWNEMKEKFQKEREETEVLLNEYYNKMLTNDEFKISGNDDEDEKVEDVKLGENEKEKLLKALKEIDLEKTGHRKGRQSSSDSEPNEPNLNSTEYQSTKAKLLNDYEFPLLRNINKDDSSSFTQNVASGIVKSKDEVMEELFGKASNIKNTHETPNNFNNL